MTLATGNLDQKLRPQEEKKVSGNMSGFCSSEFNTRYETLSGR